MNLISLIKVSFFLLMLPVFATAQTQGHFHCGTTDFDLITERLVRNKQILAERGVQQRDNVLYIPLQFHLVARDNGSSRLSPKSAYQQLCTLNDFFATNNSNLQFYLHGDFRYYDNTSYYDLQVVNGQIHDGALVSNKVFGAVNIFVVGNLPEVNGITPGGYYTPTDDMVVMPRAQAGDGDLTLAHELGHFFSLHHPFFGWDFEPWDPAIHNNPVDTYSPPASTSGTAILNEKQDGSNCEIAGDMVCDTPPDYRFNGSCNYTGGAMDPDGVLVDPDETNVMSYFISCHTYISPEQIALMTTDYENRAQLEHGYVPPAVTIDEAPELLSPPNDSNQDPDFTLFSWSAVPGATFYFFQVARSPDMVIAVQNFIVSGTSLPVGTLDPDRNYYWRVTAMNEYYTCAAPALFQTFNTDLSTSTDNIEALDRWTIAPNPVVANDEVNISVSAAEGFEGQIDLIDITGKVHRSKSFNFAIGVNDLTYSIAGLSPGMYIVSIKNENKRSTRKLVIGQ